MAIEFLDITNFRNLKHVCLEPGPRLNLLVGKNGSGKTSLLESVYFLGSARSFRTPHTHKLITIGQSEFTLFAKLRESGRLTSMGVCKSKSELKIRIANQAAKSASQLAERLAVQVINPDAHKLLEEGPRYRRRFIEWGVFHVEPSYFPLWQECRHILKQRNAALKRRVSARELRHWDGALCEATHRVATIRKHYVEQLQRYVDNLSRQVDGLPSIAIALQPGWPKDKTLADALVESRDGDLERGFTRYGPHRLDLAMTVDGTRAKDLISRGQQKVFTALLKMAQVEFLKERHPHKSIVILVDDLPAELDEEYRNVMLGMVEGLGVQAMVTATDPKFLEPRIEATGNVAMFHVEHGCVTR